jgi:hypothetical protein
VTSTEIAIEPITPTPFEKKTNIQPPADTERSLRRKVHCRGTMEADMGFGRGALLWLLGIPLPIIILLALFWR